MRQNHNRENKTMNQKHQKNQKENQKKKEAIGTVLRTSEQATLLCQGARSFRWRVVASQCNIKI